MDLARAIERQLLAIGILIGTTTIGATPDNATARVLIDETTFEAWIDGMTPTG